MIEHLSSESELLEQVKKGVRSRLQITLTTVWEDDEVVRTSRKEKTIPPDPEAVEWLRQHGLEVTN